MTSQEEIKSFLEGNDPEKYIVAVEYDYVSDKIFKIKEIPGKGKEIQRDTLISFAWVGDLRGQNFYSSSKALQKEVESISNFSACYGARATESSFSQKTLTIEESTFQKRAISFLPVFWASTHLRCRLSRTY